MEVELIKDDTRALADFDEPAVEAAAETMPNGASNLVGALPPGQLCVSELPDLASLRLADCSCISSLLAATCSPSSSCYAGSGEAQCPEGQAGAGQQDS